MEYELNTLIATSIKRYRSFHGLTQEQFAAKVYTTRNTVSLWERGEKEPSKEELQRIAEYFRISVDDLVSGKKPESAPVKDGNLVVQERIDETATKIEDAQKRITLAIDHLFDQIQQNNQQEKRIKKHRREILLIVLIGLAALIMILVLFVLLNNRPTKSGTLKTGPVEIETSIIFDEGGE